MNHDARLIRFLNRTTLCYGLAVVITGCPFAGSIRVAAAQEGPIAPIVEADPPAPQPPATSPQPPTAPPATAPQPPATAPPATAPPATAPPATAPAWPNRPPQKPTSPAAPSLLPVAPNAVPLPRPAPTSESSSSAMKEPPLPSVDLTREDVVLAGLGDEASKDVLELDVEATRFQGLQANKSTKKDAIEKLGQPLQKTPSADRSANESGEPTGPDNPNDPESFVEPQESVWSYQVGPFPRVELTFRGDLLQSIFVVVEDLPDAAEVAKQLRVDGFRGANVLSAKGEPLGVAYPERGVMLSLRQRNGTSDYGVYSIVLEPVNAELFVLRARNTVESECSNRIADLNAALHFDSTHPEACGLKARIIASLGDMGGALELCNEAIRADPQAAEWVLLSARLRAELGDPKNAIVTTKEVLLREELPDVLRAEANQLLGDLVAMTGDHDSALPYHKEAIALAAPYRTDEHAEVRRAALRVLANAHLAVANDIAWGNWRRKADVVPQWVKAGHQFADTLITHEDEEEILAQRVQRLTLSAYSGFAEWIDPSSVSKEALEHGLEMIEAAKDPLHRRRVEWELAETMYHSMVAERRRGAYQSAVEFAKFASPLFTAARKRRKLTPRESYLVGQLHFLAGSCLAVEAENHEGAVRWYDRGADLLLEPFPTSLVKDTGALGDQLVSMGVSYWRVKQTDQAIRVTMRGAQLLLEADSKDNPAEHSYEGSLRIAYSNLAAMLRAAGRNDEAERWQTRLSSLTPSRQR